jgi:hypothetical protein
MDQKSRRRSKVVRSKVGHVTFDVPTFDRRMVARRGLEPRYSGWKPDASPSMLARLLVAATELHRALRLFRSALSCVSYAAFENWSRRQDSHLLHSCFQGRQLVFFALLAIGSNAWYRPKVFRLSGGCSAFELHWNWLACMDSHHEFRINNPA